ncbi:3-hydroxyacyl-CoA dehydrogenase NAD-binding domain-containing protein [Marinobacter sp. NFXS9]|uniref:3-hydroxyacyl-CoA dehydrogenase NAD-binding domain-containing protein n=1 Tax=Marinobacter sp. NFXS9 TaxID=2818433 RepID=UPI0032DE6AD2
MADFRLDLQCDDAFAPGNYQLVRTSVIGAGVMGRGIACVCALNGLPVRIKDIRQQALDRTLAEVDHLLARRVALGRLDDDGARRVRAAIHPQLDYYGLESVTVVLEAVVDNLGVKNQVLSEVEGLLAADAVLLSNTSSLRIDDLAGALQRPQNFAGLHFFNPAPAMPLVEVIRGRRSSDYAIQTAVKLALAMGKIPIVVGDGPGFLVNRILMAYVHAFLQLLADGVDYPCIDRVAEAFGWPMGPAYLEDVVGLDVGSQSCDLIFAGYPQRMPGVDPDAFKLLLSEGWLGRKSGAGFYRYGLDAEGRQVRSPHPAARKLLAERMPPRRSSGDGEILERLMLPMIVESVHALQEQVVASAEELDRALLLGIGFPAWRGGALRYVDELGADRVVARCRRYRHLGPSYEPPELLLQKARDGGRFYADDPLENP